MGLDYNGQTNKTVTGLSIKANDAISGEAVTVIASDEAIQEHDIESVKAVASAKYDAGNLEPDGSVFVRTSDFD